MFMQSNSFAEGVDLDWVLSRAVIITLRGSHAKEGAAHDAVRRDDNSVTPQMQRATLQRNPAAGSASTLRPGGNSRGKGHAGRDGFIHGNPSLSILSIAPGKWERDEDASNPDVTKRVVAGFDCVDRLRSANDRRGGYHSLDERISATPLCIFLDEIDPLLSADELDRLCKAESK